MVLEQKPSIIVVSVNAAINVRQAAQQTSCEIRYNLATEKNFHWICNSQNQIHDIIYLSNMILL